MKKALFFLAVCLISSSLFAQQEQRQRQQRDPKEMMDRTLNKMKKELNLNEDQVKKIDKINTDFATEIKSLMASGKERSEMRSDMRELRKTNNEKVKTVLTSEQAKKWDEHQQKQKEIRQQRMKNNNNQGKRGGQRGGQRGQPREQAR